jgi:DNA replication licensing factor MCM5
MTYHGFNCFLVLTYRTVEIHFLYSSTCACLCLCISDCKATKTVSCGAGFGGARFPRTCDTNINAGAGAEGLNVQKCPLDPYIILADNSEYVNQQRLKLQENPENVPTGELPRHLSLSLDRYLVGSVKPGTRVGVVGMYTTYEAISGGGGADKDQRQQGASDAGIRIPYLRVLGIEQESEATDVMLGKYNTSDEEELRDLAATPDLYNKITGSMCPAIFDNEDTRNIKQSIAVQLFGGSRKQLPDGMRLRGDINVLLLGDPSVAKSQFLKFASQVAPIGVYTSGKGASAAGLTATVIRDVSSGEFHLEGGALVLADGGLVCIDEFDKMREQDRVAIHEAMEQQTISIAKAGITTILNSRTSVLAAANPVFGRYDDMRSPTDNIDFQTTILSRFDLIFIIRDVQDMERSVWNALIIIVLFFSFVRKLIVCLWDLSVIFYFCLFHSDRRIVGHIFNMHNKREEAVKVIQDESGMVEIKQLKKYIAYARKTCHPRLNEEAAELLKNQYVKFRGNVVRGAQGAGTSIPITVRQLEAVVRISEARARMELKKEATTEHVQEALRLFQVSTYRAATTGMGEGGVGGAKFDEMVRKK